MAPLSGERGRGTASSRNSHKDRSTDFAVSQKAKQLVEHSPNPCRNSKTESDRRRQWHLRRKEAQKDPQNFPLTGFKWWEEKERKKYRGINRVGIKAQGWRTDTKKKETNKRTQRKRSIFRVFSRKCLHRWEEQHKSRRNSSHMWREQAIWLNLVWKCLETESRDQEK